MTRVAFWFDRPVEYTGGLNYMRNLLHAISVVNEGSIEPYIFFGNKVNENVLDQFRPYAKVVQTAVLDRRSFPWFMHKIFFKLFGSLLVLNFVMKKYSISVLSHAENVYGVRKTYRIVTWIPDFQYLKLPEMFPNLRTDHESARLRKMINGSDVIVLSSLDAFSDFKKVAPSFDNGRVRVMQFVSQPSDMLFEEDSLPSVEELEAKYCFSGKYFFLPNQFWKHKNHQVVLEAVKLLKGEGHEILVICTGNRVNFLTNDTEYADSLQEFIDANSIASNVKILGLIDYKEVLTLMRNAVAVINPSRFEGWSSSVEEAKSIGKKVILSNINVHLEQNPPGGYYFHPDDQVQLAAALIQVWNNVEKWDDVGQMLAAREVLERRTTDFGKAYLSLIDELIPNGSVSGC